MEHRGERWWLVEDQESAHRCGLDVLDGLTGYGLAQVERLRRRSSLLDTIERGDLGRRRPSPDVLPMNALLLHADEGDVESFTHIAASLRPAVPRFAHVLAWTQRRLESRVSS